MSVPRVWINKQGRRCISVYDPVTQKNSAKTYARYLMEQHLGRKLLPDEHVDHINNDKTDDRIENYQILSPADNLRKSLFLGYKVFSCPLCGEFFELLISVYNSRQSKLNSSDLYCSKSCATKAAWVRRRAKE